MMSLIIQVHLKCCLLKTFLFMNTDKNRWSRVLFSCFPLFKSNGLRQYKLPFDSIYYHSVARLPTARGPVIQSHSLSGTVLKHIP